MHCGRAAGRSSRESRTEPQPRPARGTSASAASAPVRFRARAAAITNGEKPGAASPLAPPPARANPGPGRGWGGATCSASRWPGRSSLEGGGSPPPGLYPGCQLRGAASSVPAGHAGSKPRPREVAFCLKHLPPGEAALWQGGNSEPLLLLRFLRGPLYVSLSPSSPVLPLHTDTRLP